ncbi:MAG: mandelate racemase/muconate lactonizing enzyme family protein [Actinomycetia bacterium]|nr:mandelate racemase/muconate lactonizing enzyme family protein [Actinomycetes bacterium]
MARITDVTVQFFRYRPPNPLVSSLGQRTDRVWCLVAVHTDEGVTGYGESWVNFPAWAPQERRATLLAGIRPLIIGEDPTQVTVLHARLEAALGRVGLQWGSPGAIAQALSGVDLALWDVTGKLYGVPVYRLLGGGAARVPVYASGLGPGLDEDVVRQHQAWGIHVFKVRVGFGREQDIEAVARLREWVGPAATILVDANQAWTPREAVDRIGALEPYGIAWVEEPIRADDLDGYKWVAARVRVPLAAGENWYGLRTFAGALQSGAVQIIQPDVTKVGGLTAGWAIARWAAAWGCRWAPHFLGHRVGLLASAHLMAAVPGGLWLELDTAPNPLRTASARDPLVIREGQLDLPDRPGWGVDLDEDSLAPFAFDPRDEIDGWERA